MNEEEGHNNKQSDRDIHRKREIERCNIEYSRLHKSKSTTATLKKHLRTEDNYHRINNSIITFTDETTESAVGALQHTLK